MPALLRQNYTENLTNAAVDLALNCKACSLAESFALPVSTVQLALGSSAYKQWAKNLEAEHKFQGEMMKAVGNVTLAIGQLGKSLAGFVGALIRR